MRPVQHILLHAGAALLLTAGLASADETVTDADLCFHGQDAQGIAACTRAIASGRHDGDPVMLARLFLHRGALYGTSDIDNALADSVQATLINPGDPDAFRDTGSLYLVKGNDFRALAMFDKAAQLSPDDAAIRKLREEASQKTKTPGHPGLRSNADFAKDAMAYVAKAQGETRQKDYAAALADLTRAIGTDPYLPGPYVLRAGVYGSTGKWEDAIVDGMTSVRLAPQNSDNHFLLGFSLLAVKDYARAIASFSQASRLKPDEPDYLGMVADAKEEAGDLRGAYDAYQQLLTLKPGDQKTTQKIAALGAKLGIAASDQDLTPPDMVAHGRAVEAQGDFRSAAQKYVRALKADKNFDGAKEALAALDRQHAAALCDGAACGGLKFVWDKDCLTFKNVGDAVIDVTVDGPGVASSKRISISPGGYKGYAIAFSIALGLPMSNTYCATAEAGTLMTINAGFNQGQQQKDWQVYDGHWQDAQKELAKGSAALQAGDLDAAIPALTAAIAAGEDAHKLNSNVGVDLADKTLAAANDALGVALERRGDLAKATPHLNRAIQLEPKNLDYLLDSIGLRIARGQLWDDGWQHFGALGELDLAAKLAPDDPRIAPLRAKAEAALTAQEAALRESCKGDACGGVEMHWRKGCLDLKNVSDRTIGLILLNKGQKPAARFGLLAKQHMDGWLHSQQQDANFGGADWTCTTAELDDYVSMRADYYVSQVNCADDPMACALAK